MITHTGARQMYCNGVGGKDVPLSFVLIDSIGVREELAEFRGAIAPSSPHSTVR